MKRNLQRDAINRYQLQLPWSPGRTMSVAQVAALFDCANETVRHMIERGELIAYQLRSVTGSPFRIYKDSVAKHLQKIDQGLAWVEDEARSAQPAKTTNNR